MYVRSSMSLPAFAAAAVCLFALPALAAGPPPTPGDQLTADGLPELGDPVAAPTGDASAPTLGAAKPGMLLAKMDLNTPVSRLCADPRAKAVLDTDLPGLTTRPEFPFFKGMSLNTLKKMSRGQMSDADLAKVQAELAQIDEGGPPEAAAK